MGTADHVNVCTELNNKSTHAAQWGLMLRQLPSRYATEGKPSNWSKQGVATPWSKVHLTAADPGLAGKMWEKPS